MPPWDKRTPAERFWSFVEKTDGCWLWRGSSNGKYGHFYITHGVRVYAHRYSVLLSGRDIGETQCIMHLCDNPQCVRPDHLRVASYSDNIRDSYEKRRNPGNRLGERTHCKRGHPFGDNPPRDPKNNYRICVTCRRLKGARYRSRMRAA